MSLQGQMAKILSHYDSDDAAIEQEQARKAEEFSAKASMSCLDYVETMQAKDRGYPLQTADTMARGSGSKLVHAHDHDARGESGPALCGYRPGRSTYWSGYWSGPVTCSRCLRKLGGVK